MNKQWKCGDCCCFGTYACRYLSMETNDIACVNLVVDHDNAYLQGRNDAIDEIINIIDNEYYDDGYGTYHEVEMIVRTLEKLKENKNE